MASMASTLFSEMTRISACKKEETVCVLNQLFSFLFLLVPKGTDKTSHKDKARNAIVSNLSTMGRLSADNLIARLRVRVILAPCPGVDTGPGPTGQPLETRHGSGGQNTS